MNPASYFRCFDKSPLAFIVTEMEHDDSGRPKDFIFRYVNAACETILEDFSREKLLGQSFHAVFGRYNTKLLGLYNEVATTGESREVVDYNPELGKTLRVQLYSPMENYCACILTDISRQNRVENELLFSSSALAATLNISGLLYCEYDAGEDTFIIRQDPSRILTGAIAVSNMRMTAAALSDIIVDDSREAYNSLLLAIRTGKEVVQDLHLHTAHGASQWVRVRCTSVSANGSNTRRTICIAERITDIKDFEKLFRTTLHQMHAAVCTYEIGSKRIIHWDESNNLYGDDGLVVDGVPELALRTKRVHPDDINVYKDMYASLQAGVAHVTATVRWRNRPNDEWRWLKILYTNVFNSAGKPVRALCVTLDVTDQKKEEEEYTQWIKTLIGSGGQACHCNLSTDVCVDNDGASGKDAARKETVDEYFARYCRAIPNLNDMELFRQKFSRSSLLQQFEAGNRVVTAQHRKLERDGSILWIRTSATLIKNPHTEDVEGIIRHTTIDSAIDSPLAIDYDYIVEIDIKKNIFWCLKSREATRSNLLTGNNYTTEMISYINLYVVEEDRREAIRNVLLSTIRKELAQRPSYEFYYHITEENGAIARKRARFTALDKTHTRVLFTRMDIPSFPGTEHFGKASGTGASAELTGDAFLSSMNHALRTPLNTIIGLGHLAAEHPDVPPETQNDLKRIDSAAQTLLRQIDMLLSIADLRRGALGLRQEPFSLSSLLANLDADGADLAAARGLDWRCLGPETDVQFLGDAERLRQAVWPVLDNAAKFSQPGGSMSLECRVLEERNGQVQLRLTVLDAGCGVPVNMLPRVCQAFACGDSGASARYGGAGLGLALSSGLARLMGGSVQLHNRSNGGVECRVEIWLTRADTAQPGV